VFAQRLELTYIMGVYFLLIKECWH